MAKVRQLVQQSHHLEQQPDLALGAYADPTAAAYGYLAEAIARAAPGRCPAGQAREAGRILGTLVYVADAAKDYRSDRRQGRFNPLPAAPAEAAAAISTVIQSLTADLASLRLPGASQQKFRALVARIERHRRRLAAGDRSAAREPQVALNLICCMPCGPGGVAVEDDDVVGLCVACCCCCLCTSCLSSC